MKSNTPVYEIKNKAKEKLLGNYSTVVGSFVLLFAFMYVIVSLISSVTMSFVFGRSAADAGINSNSLLAMMADEKSEIMLTILSYLVMAVVTPAIAIMSTGFTYIIREISYGREAKASDLFYPLKNHPDRIIVIALICYVVQVVTAIPATIYSFYMDPLEFSGKQFLAFVCLRILGAIISMVFSMAVSQVYILYLENPEEEAMACIKNSIILMKGNKWKLFYLLLSFIGYGFLVLLSLGVAAIFIVPYQEMTLVEFYRDITENPTLDIAV